MGRYNAKIRDAAKGLGRYRNIFSIGLTRQGFNLDELALGRAVNFSDNILSASMAFDHFSHLLARPEHGAHMFPNEDVVRSKSARSSCLESPTQLS